MSNMKRYISKDGGAVICVLDSTNIVKTMEEMHKTSAVVSAALGRLLTAASLMGSWLKNAEDSITLRVDGGGDAGTLLVVTDGEGNVRGYAANPVAERPIREDGKLDVGGVVGNNGTLSVIKDLGMKEPYIGQVPLVSGEIAEDITAYYASSEQTPSVCALGVLVNPDLSIRCAGGYLIQLMPGASNNEIDIIEKNVAGMLSITEHFENGGTVDDLALKAFKGLEPKLLEERQTEYKCYCNEEKTKDILIGLGKNELEEMLKEQQTVHVECHFCNKSYNFELQDIIKEATK